MKASDTIQTMICDECNVAGTGICPKCDIKKALDLLEKAEQNRIIELPAPIGEECWVVINDKHIEKRNLIFDTFSAYGNGYIFATKEEAENRLAELRGDNG